MAILFMKSLLAVSIIGSYRVSIPGFSYLGWMDDWLRSPALDNLQDLELNSHSPQGWCCS
jgi:hypothetical protein